MPSVLFGGVRAYTCCREYSGKNGWAVLERYGVSNFKAIGEEVSIEIRPITLLFGPNSSGKSSILQSMLVLDEILSSGGIDVHRTPSPRSVIDVGGIAQFAHKGRTEEGVTWILTLGPTEGYAEGYNEWTFSNLPQTLFEARATYRIRAFEEVYRHTDSSWSHPFLTMQVSIQDEELICARTGGGRSGKRWSANPSIATFNTDHPIVLEYFRRLVVEGKYKYDFSGSELELEQISTVVLNAIQTELALTSSDHERFSWRHASANRHLSRSDAELTSLAFLCAHEVSAGHAKVARAILETYPDNFDWHSVGEYLRMEKRDRAEDISWTRFCERWAESGNLATLGPLDDYADGFQNTPEEHASGWVYDLFSETLSVFDRLVSAPRLELTSFHLGPMRFVPQRHEAFHQLSVDETAIGQSDWLHLTESDEARTVVNEWLGDGRLGGSLELVPQKILLESDVRRALEAVLKARRRSDMPEALSEELRSMRSLGATAQLLDKRTGVMVGVQDVGYGIGQVLPVLSRALGKRSGLHLIEQPEIHLHPSLQADLADVFILGGVTSHSKQFILETHSEHLILRLLRRVRETSLGSNPPRLELHAEDLSVNYIRRDEEGATRSTHIEVSGDGDFLDEWPDGFFPERLEELG